MPVVPVGGGIFALWIFALILGYYPWVVLLVLFGPAVLGCVLMLLYHLYEKWKARREIAKGHYYYFGCNKIYFYKSDDRAVLLKAMRAAHDWWGSFDVDLDDAPYLRETVVELAAENNFLLRNQDLRAQVDALRMTRFRDKLKNAVRASAGQATAQANAAVARALIREAQNHLTH